MPMAAFVDLLDLRTSLFFLFVFILTFYFLKKKNPPNFPPGPRGLPFLGHISVALDHLTVEKLSVKYGEIFSLTVASQKIVLVSGSKLVKEVLVTQGHNFLDRPVSPLFNEVFQGNGLCTTSGHRWRRHRHFFESQLKKFGEGKRKQESVIEQESIFLCEAVQEQMGRSFNPHLIINSAVANVIASLVFGMRFDYDATDFQNFLNLITETNLLAGSPFVQLYNAFPSLLKRFQGPHTTILLNYAKLVSFLKKEIEKHKKDWDPFNHRDFTDVYIGEIDKRRKDVDAAFSVDNLAHCILDLFEAGTGPMTSTLCWGLLLMAKHPEVQREVQAETDRVIGRLVDRAGMPYTEAVLQEIQRVGNILPLGVPHRAGRDTTLGNFFIPKGTVVVTSLSSLLNDEDEWERPQQFHPEHFLDEQGHFRKREAFLPFSAGKRGCLGEKLASTELFLFFASLLQRFTFSAPAGVQLSVEAQGVSLLSPKPFHICVSSR